MMAHAGPQPRFSVRSLLMYLAIPAQVIEIMDKEHAVVDMGDVHKTISTWDIDFHRRRRWLGRFAREAWRYSDVGAEPSVGAGRRHRWL